MCRMDGWEKMDGGLPSLESFIGSCSLSYIHRHYFLHRVNGFNNTDTKRGSCSEFLCIHVHVSSMQDLQLQFVMLLPVS